MYYTGWVKSSYTVILYYILYTYSDPPCMKANLDPSTACTHRVSKKIQVRTLHLDFGVFRFLIT
jgi:hypothetical protein